MAILVIFTDYVTNKTKQTLTTTTTTTMMMMMMMMMMMIVIFTEECPLSIISMTYCSNVAQRRRLRKKSRVYEAVNIVYELFNLPLLSRLASAFPADPLSLYTQRLAKCSRHSSLGEFYLLWQRGILLTCLNDFTLRG
jgi:hypothetical protein